MLDNEALKIHSEKGPSLCPCGAYMFTKFARILTKGLYQTNGRQGDFSNTRLDKFLSLIAGVPNQIVKPIDKVFIIGLEKVVGNEVGDI